MKILKLVKDLGEKVKQSLKEPEAKDIFPKFIDYLKEEYGFLTIEKTENAINPSIWIINTEYKAEGTTPVGIIRHYIENKGIISEHGYQVGIFTKGKYVRLKYRKGHYLIDTLHGYVSVDEDPLRYDNEKVPFP